MANTLGYYNPQFYANEALIQLEKALGMAGRVHLGYDAERRSFNKGEFINISRPGNFTVQDAPSTIQDVTPDQVQMQLAYWREVKFGLTDKELAFTQEKIISDHIRPAAVKLADDVDQKLAALYKDIPWANNLVGSSAAIADLTNAYQTQFDNLNPVTDESNMHMMINGKMQNDLSQIATFNQWTGGGQDAVNTQRRGSLGQKFGYNLFANQNVPTHTPGAPVLTSPVSATTAAGATSIVVTGSSGSGTLKKGDIVSIAGVTQKFAVAADVTLGATSVTIQVSPPVPVAFASGAVVSWDVEGTKVKQNLAFHRNAFALATAPLSMIGAQLGAKMAIAQDPKTGLALRSRMWYDGDESKVKVALDILYGVKTLDANLAVRIRAA